MQKSTTTNYIIQVRESLKNVYKWTKGEENVKGKSVLNIIVGQTEVLTPSVTQSVTVAQCETTVCPFTLAKVLSF